MANSSVALEPDWRQYFLKTKQTELQTSFKVAFIAWRALCLQRTTRLNQTKKKMKSKFKIKRKELFYGSNEDLSFDCFFQLTICTFQTRCHQITIALFYWTYTQDNFGKKKKKRRLIAVDINNVYQIPDGKSLFLFS